MSFFACSLDVRSILSDQMQHNTSIIVSPPPKNVSLVFLLHISDLVPSTSLTVPLVEKYLLFIMISGKTSVCYQMIYQDEDA